MGMIGEEQELAIDLSEYIVVVSDDNESHVSSSQRTTDGSQELPYPPPNSQQVRAGVDSVEEPTNFPTRTLPQLNIDEGDLPSWMLSKGQWKYVASTAGGESWEASSCSPVTVNFRSIS